MFCFGRRGVTNPAISADFSSSGVTGVFLWIMGPEFFPSTRFGTAGDLRRIWPNSNFPSRGEPRTVLTSLCHDEKKTLRNMRVRNPRSTGEIRLPRASKTRFSSTHFFPSICGLSKSHWWTRGGRETTCCSSFILPGVSIVLTLIGDSKRDFLNLLLGPTRRDGGMGREK